MYIFIYIIICMYVCMYVRMYQGRIKSDRFGSGSRSVTRSDLHRSGREQGRVGIGRFKSHCLPKRIGSDHNECQGLLRTVPNRFGTLPFFSLSVGPNSGLCKGWVRRIRGELLGGCLMKAVTLNDIHPIYPPHPL